MNVAAILTTVKEQEQHWFDPKHRQHTQQCHCWESDQRNKKIQPMHHPNWLYNNNNNKNTQQHHHHLTNNMSIKGSKAVQHIYSANEKKNNWKSCRHTKHNFYFVKQV